MRPSRLHLDIALAGALVGACSEEPKRIDDPCKGVIHARFLLGRTEQVDAGPVLLVEAEVCADRCVRFDENCHVVSGDGPGVTCRVSGGFLEVSYVTSTWFNQATLRVFDGSGAAVHEDSHWVSIGSSFSDGCPEHTAVFGANYVLESELDGGDGGPEG